MPHLATCAGHANVLVSTETTTTKAREENEPVGQSRRSRRLRGDNAQRTSLDHRRNPISLNSRVLLTGGTVGNNRAFTLKADRGAIFSSGSNAAAPAGCCFPLSGLKEKLSGRMHDRRMFCGRLTLSVVFDTLDGDRRAAALAFRAKVQTKKKPPGNMSRFQ